MVTQSNGVSKEDSINSLSYTKYFSKYQLTASKTHNAVNSNNASDDSNSYDD